MLVQKTKTRVPSITNETPQDNEEDYKSYKAF